MYFDLGGGSSTCVETLIDFAACLENHCTISVTYKQIHCRPTPNRSPPPSNDRQLILTAPIWDFLRRLTFGIGLYIPLCIMC